MNEFVYYLAGVDVGLFVSLILYIAFRGKNNDK